MHSNATSKLQLGLMYVGLTLAGPPCKCDCVIVLKISLICDLLSSPISQRSELTAHDLTYAAKLEA